MTGIRKLISSFFTSKIEELDLMTTSKVSFGYLLKLLTVAKMLSSLRKT
jgi:hypothetical protein